MSVEQDFAGKVALVSGAGKNIGRTIALDLAARGASLVVNGRADRTAVDGVVAEINAAGGQAIGCLADVSDPVATGTMIEAAVAAFGGIDILVSNAGLRRQTPFLEMPWPNGERFCRSRWTVHSSCAARRCRTWSGGAAGRSSRCQGFRPMWARRTAAMSQRRRRGWRG
jgi:NAD(P)-dependent dehydrogenase (short-subunit alcohol dehydrogenase family)